MTPSRAAAAVLRVAAAALLAVRRRAPITCAGLCCACFAVSTMLTPGSESLSEVIVVLVVVYGAIVDARSWAAASVPVALFFVAGTLVDLADYRDLGGALTTTALWAAGIVAVAGAVRQARQRSDAEARRAELERELGDRRTREALDAERTRIARDIHDIVAHALSIAVLNARGGRKVLAHDTAAAEQALTTIELAAEQALTELRRLVELLRDQPADLQPQPSLRDLAALVDASVPAAIDTRLQVRGDIGRLGPGLDVAAYRIVQEALTNVLKHADAQRVSIEVDATADRLRIDVADDGRGAGITPGNGILGMRERAQLFGGTVQTITRRPHRGIQVSAEFPVQDKESSAPPPSDDNS